MDENEVVLVCTTGGSNKYYKFYLSTDSQNPGIRVKYGAIGRGGGSDAFFCDERDVKKVSSQINSKRKKGYCFSKIGEQDVSNQSLGEQFAMKLALATLFPKEVPFPAKPKPETVQPLIISDAHYERLNNSNVIAPIW